MHQEGHSLLIDCLGCYLLLSEFFQEVFLVLFAAQLCVQLVDFVLCQRKRFKIGGEILLYRHRSSVFAKRCHRFFFLLLFTLLLIQLRVLHCEIGIEGEIGIDFFHQGNIFLHTLLLCFSLLLAPSIVIVNFLIAFWILRGRVTDKCLFEKPV